jgi:hypothetical protein
VADAIRARRFARRRGGAAPQPTRPTRPTSTHWLITRSWRNCQDLVPSRLAAEALAATAEIGSENGKADILAWLINYLSGSLVPEAASISIALQDEGLRVETLHALIPCLSVDVLSVVLAAAESISDSYHRSLLVEALAHHVPADLAST